MSGRQYINLETPQLTINKSITFALLASKYEIFI